MSDSAVTSSDIFEGIAAMSQLGMAVMVGLGVVVAWRQLDTWKRERIETKKAELGEELIAIVAEIVGRFSMIRSPFGYGPPEGEADDGTYDYRRRLNEVAELDEEFNKLRQMKVRQKAYFDLPEVTDAIEAVFDARSKLIMGLQGMIRQVRHETLRGAAYTEKAAERVARYQALIWDSFSEAHEEEDPVRAILDPAFQKIEEEMTPVVRMEMKK